MNAVKIFLMAVLLISVTMSAFGQQRPASSQPGGQYNDTTGVGNPGQTGTRRTNVGGKTGRGQKKD